VRLLKLSNVRKGPSSALYDIREGKGQMLFVCSIQDVKLFALCFLQLLGAVCMSHVVSGANQKNGPCRKRRLKD
jgi:hypothetical protein